MTTFVDTSVVIDLLDPNSKRHIWSLQEIAKAKAIGPVIIPDIAYCELSIGMPSKAATDEAIASLSLERLPCSDESLFLAGKAFKKYRDNHKGTKNNVLPDFLIGAQAQTENAPLLTANQKDFQTYFATIGLICPP